jgi:hypothetical protein
MTFDVKEARNEILHGMDMGREYLAAIDAAHAAELAAASPVVWAPTGLDRLHVASGTVWTPEDHRGRFIRQMMSEVIFVHRIGKVMCAVGRQSAASAWAWMVNPDEDGDHRSHLIQRGTEESESLAMSAALSAAGWKR